jgi:glutathione S-transferase
MIELPHRSLKISGMVPYKPEQSNRYTVPAIHHVPTNTYIMDSVPISQFLEVTYPSRPVPLDHDDIAAKVWATIPPLLIMLEPRKPAIMDPISRADIIPKTEGMMGAPLGDLIAASHAGEEETWKTVDAGLRELGQMMTPKEGQGPFIKGQSPTMTDFLVVGVLCYFRAVDEGAFRRMFTYPGWGDAWTACEPFTNKKD